MQPAWFATSRRASLLILFSLLLKHWRSRAAKPVKIIIQRPVICFFQRVIQWRFKNLTLSLSVVKHLRCSRNELKNTVCDLKSKGNQTSSVLSHLTTPSGINVELSVCSADRWHQNGTAPSDSRCRHQSEPSGSPGCVSNLAVASVGSAFSPPNSCRVIRSFYHHSISSVDSLFSRRGEGRQTWRTPTPRFNRWSRVATRRHHDVFQHGHDRGVKDKEGGWTRRKRKEDAARSFCFLTSENTKANVQPLSAQRT